MNDSTILHYRVLRELGSGGMGVVYEAEDLNLGRRLALKFLPNDLAGNDAARERFLREARAASALNHPNICTIYAVERDGDRHFIAMELLEGEPLDRRLLAGAMPVEALLDVAIQISDALDAAHQAGIVHRDIKPGNIFLTRSGRVKVLDFGLAKFAKGEVADAAAADGATVDRSAPHLTSPGSTVGTIAFMSPEQARGEELDARSDLFSFGSVLYQMATGVLPFAGATSAVIFSGILKEAPVPPLRRNAALPPKLGDVIERALEKDRDLRFQSAAEMRSELKRLKRDTSSGKSAVAVPIVSDHAADSAAGAQVETRAGAPAPRDPVAAPSPHDSASIPATHASGSSVIAAAAKQHKVGIAVALVMLLAVLAAAGFGIYSLMHRVPQESAGANISFTPLTSSGNVRGSVAISGDGRYVVYCLDERPKKTLWVKQVATGSTVKIGEYADKDVKGATFSPDGDFLYLTLHSPRQMNADLYRIPVLGGEARQVMTKVDSPVAFSPDGKQVAFVRLLFDLNDQLVVASADGSGERVIATSKGADGWFMGWGVAWTPDGQQILVSWATLKGGAGLQVATVNVSDGTIKPLIDRRWKTGVGRPVALADKSGIIFTAQDIPNTNQLWFSDYSGHARQLTHDQNNYGVSPAVTADTKIIAAAQAHTYANLAVVDGGGSGELRPLTSGDMPDGVGVFDASDDGGVVYSAWQNGHPVLMYLAAGSTNPSIVTDSTAYSVALSPDGKFAIFTPWQEFDVHRINVDGSGMRQLTHSRTDVASAISTDGQCLWFVHMDGNKSVIQKMPADGSSAPVTVVPGDGVRISPDGKSLLIQSPDGRSNELWSVEGEFQKTIELPPNAVTDSVRWMPGSQSVSFVVTADGAQNIWSMPLAGENAQQITHFKDGLIFNHAWAAKTNQLILSKGHVTNDVVLIRDWR